MVHLERSFYILNLSCKKGPQIQTLGVDWHAYMLDVGSNNRMDNVQKSAHFL